MAPIAPTNSEMDLILVEERFSARTFILNRPKQLNALNYPMISRLLELSLKFEKDPNVKLILLKGTGRAFCAGGDVANVVRDISQGNWKLGAHFFRKEFSLNYLLATYSKPQVSILNGIVMGGGAGISIHGRFRVATENSVFAMPETALGLFPDIGASYFLSRLPGFFASQTTLEFSHLFSIASVMVRRKVKLAYIVNNADRLASYRKREKSILNKAYELSKLCGIDMFAIVYAQHSPQPTLYPAAPDKVQQLIARFRALEPAEQRKRMENQEAYMGKTLTKAQAKLNSLQRDNREMELTQFVNECLEDRNKVDSLGQKDLLDMDTHIELKLKEINRRLELMKMQSPGREEEKGPAVAAPASAHEDN